MWLKQMVIDGFKSYAQRTVISNWDRHFTAITGLNGSGKSNILDAICFVLGITNLSQVRVENLQQLVYKEGQARVTKASVSLVFDNRDINSSPIGYEDYDEITVTRQVVIGGRNKYMINGQTAQLSRIRDLFHSVQLDVNNPHFLIMQGRITKVLNMKPAEILSMIQEAAGTKMYELKKLQAIKTMNKKQVKVNEINQILEEEITPQLEKLRKEKTNYLKWTKNNNEIEKLNRLIIVYKFINNYNGINNSKNKLNELNENQNEMKCEMEFLKDNCDKIRMKINLIISEKQKLNGNNGNIIKFNNELNIKNKKLKLLQQQIKNINDNIQNENKEFKLLNKQLNSNNEIILNKNNEYKLFETKYNNINSKTAYLIDRIQSLESQLLGIGIKEKNGSLAQQLMESKKQKSEIKSSITNTKNDIKNITKNVNKLNREIKVYNNNHNKLVEEYDIKLNKLNKLKKEREILLNKSSDVDEKDEKELISNVSVIRNNLYKLKNELNSLKSSTSRFDFVYNNPYPSFDRSRVYGKLGKLFCILDNQYCKSIEICGGGKLYNVVVDTNDTARELLQNGKLKRRVTIIPLNKISSSIISRKVISFAKNLVGEDHCWLALELINFDNHLIEAMKYAFASSFICTDMNSAKQIAFNKNVQCKSVTLDGDCFNPSGLLTGGSSNNNKSILLNIKLYSDKLIEYNNLENELKKCENQLDNYSKQNEINNKMQSEIEILEHELNLLKDRINDSGYSCLKKRISELNINLNNKQNEFNKFESNLNLINQKCNDLEKDMNNYEERKNDQIKSVKKEIIESKNKLKQLDSTLKETENNKTRLNQEINDLNEEIDALKLNINNIQNNLNKYKNEDLISLNNNIENINNLKKEIEIKLKKEKDILLKKDLELKKLNKIIIKNEKEYNSMDLSISSMENNIKNLNDQIKHSERVINKLFSEFDWLKQESQDINAMCSQYKYSSSQSYKDIIAKSSALKQEQSTLSSKINHKVMSMFERAENEYRDLKKKREIIRNDKKKIESVIRELDKKKEDTLENTYLKVNEHFGNIFSKLLPGTQCKLSKMNNKDNGGDGSDDNKQEASILCGLEVRVAFGKDSTTSLPIWKESLSELSGGQRSLLALSLILSLLLFKPAPLYILDEIDAALDLSHTQNIGILISKYFTNSQFIVVSLKEGMFTNANVIFRTSFVDGVSAVKRTVGSGLRNQNNNNKENDDNNNNNNNNRRRGRNRMR